MLVCQKENINLNRGNLLLLLLLLLLLFRISQDNVYSTYIRLEILEQTM